MFYLICPNRDIFIVNVNGLLAPNNNTNKNISLFIYIRKKIILNSRYLTINRFKNVLICNKLI